MLLEYKFICLSMKTEIFVTRFYLKYSKQVITNIGVMNIGNGVISITIGFALKCLQTWTYWYTFTWSLIVSVDEPFVVSLNKECHWKIVISWSQFKQFPLHYFIFHPYMDIYVYTTQISTNKWPEMNYGHCQIYPYSNLFFFIS